MDDRIKYFFPKVKTHIVQFKNKLWEHLPIEKISLRGIGHISSKESFIEQLTLLLGTDYIEVLSSVRKEEKESILRYADNALEHKFCYLGVDKKFSDGIEWNVDFRTGFRWPENLYYKKQSATTQKGSDIKFPWELSRCHQLLWLGEAYLITGDEKYANEVVEDLYDWINKNPLMYTVNWTCAMEVAIRSVNWLYALLFIKDSKHLTDELVTKVYKSLFQHGFYIKNNLEKTVPYSNNHYYSDIIGLLYLGRLFRNSRTGRNWYKFALKEYCKETLVQNLPSGVNYEKSVSYHRLMTELSLYPCYMLERICVSVPKEVKERLSKMLDYICLYTMPNDNAPLIADNDDGRFLPFVPRDFRTHSYLTEVDSLESKIVSKGLEQINEFKAEPKSHLFDDSKVAVLRRGESYLFINNADRWRKDKASGRYEGSHMHSDLLSFVYAVGESEIFVDSGSYVYTSDLEKHKEFRSTAKHNTVVVDGEEQHLRERKGAFNMLYNSTSQPLTFNYSNDYDECTGEYTTMVGIMTHNRTFRLYNNELTITDKLTKSGNNHHTVLYFHLAPGIEPTLADNDVVFAFRGKTFVMNLKSDKELNMSIKEDSFSPSYGVLQGNKTLVVELIFDEKTEITTKINYKKNG